MPQEATLFACTHRPSPALKPQPAPQPSSPSTPPPRQTPCADARPHERIASRTREAHELTSRPLTPASQTGVLPDGDDRLLITEREAAAALSISPRKLWELRTRGDIPHVRLGRAVRYAPHDLAAWVTQQRR